MTFKSIHDFIDYLENHYMPDPKHYLDFVACMEALGNPQKQLACIHIGGTNGKGSTSNYVRSILEEAGYRVGLYTSPHLKNYNDRIRINNVEIPDEHLLAYANHYVEHWEKYQCSMVEIMTLISFRYFIDEGVDYAVYEVGKGGRFDSTNVISPLVTALTNIEYDHMEVFGSRLADIAYHKTGIIKNDIPLVTTERKVAAKKMIEEACKEINAPFIYVEKPPYQVVEDHLVFEWYSKEVTLNTLALYQIENASLALGIIDSLQKHQGIKIDWEICLQGIEKAIWAGRFEVVGKNPLVILDGAHNEHGTKLLIESAQNLKKPLIIIYSAIQGKSHQESLRKLSAIADEIIITEFDYSRRLTAEELAEGFDYPIYKEFPEALAYAKTIVEEGTILVTGSLYLISEVRKFFK